MTGSGVFTGPEPLVAEGYGQCAGVEMVENGPEDGPQPYVAVLWDVDGTLVDSEPVHFIVCKEMLGEFGYNLTVEEYNRTRGATAAQFFGIFRDRCPAFPKDATLEDLGEKSAVRFAEKVADAVPRPGVVELVRRLKSRGVLQTAASSGLDSAIRPVAKHTPEFNSFLPTMVTLDHVKLPKPDPESYLLAAQRLGVDIKRCVAVDDSVAGTTAGKAAGALVIGWPQIEGLDLSHCDYVVESLDEVPWEKLFGKG